MEYIAKLAIEYLNIQKKSSDDIKNVAVDYELAKKDFINPNENKDKKKIKYHNYSQEERIRKLLENFFNKPFPKVRLKSMINPKTKKPLELDCYNHSLGLAVEIQGQQHSRFIPYFHKSLKDFQDQQERDRFKYTLCRQHGIRLVYVNYDEISTDMLDSDVINILKQKIAKVV